ncbi:energy-coupling factor transporter transmembrane protein EcfT [Dictyobacter vulcani]|uniref:Energy-coupling factor transporter transmembrane protein EcfT n=1 Tax=Dictyobacter vulcani TaxID=2607529 RepID=A0A5J4L024_9CHLR|nr:energy-coupling factor transporter transmembrane component T [Dictyobacter vulcani]GER92107.1 energy-coupling factor transporter transmembrane protein EcfT [Dictyobacter vulcani]
MINWLLYFLSQSLLARTIISYILMFIVPFTLPAFLITLVGVQGLRHLFSYEPQVTFVHTLDARIKVLYPFIISTLSILLNWNFVYLLLIFAIIPWILVRPSAARTRVVLTMVMIPALGIIWSQSLYYTVSTTGLHMLYSFPSTVSWLGTPGVSREGLVNGLQQAGRVMVATSATLILLMTTKPSEIIWAFYKFRMPATVGLAFTVALRFLPQLIERTTVLLQVVQVRGYDLSRPTWHEASAWPGYLRRIFTVIPIVTVPLLIGSLRSTSTTAMVVDARAFGTQQKRTFMHEHRLQKNDYLAIGALALLTLGVILLLVLNIAVRQS